MAAGQQAGGGKEGPGAGLSEHPDGQQEGAAQRPRGALRGSRPEGARVIYFLPFMLSN